MDEDFRAEEENKAKFETPIVKGEIPNEEFNNMEYKIESKHEFELDWTPDEADNSINDPNEITHIFICPLCQKKFTSLSDTRQHLLKVS